MRETRKKIIGPERRSQGKTMGLAGKQVGKRISKRLRDGNEKWTGKKGTGQAKECGNQKWFCVVTLICAMCLYILMRLSGFGRLFVPMAHRLLPLWLTVVLYWGCCLIVLGIHFFFTDVERNFPQALMLAAVPGSIFVILQYLFFYRIFLFCGIVLMGCLFLLQAGAKLKLWYKEWGNADFEAVLKGIITYLIVYVDVALLVFLAAGVAYRLKFPVGISQLSAAMYSTNYNVMEQKEGNGGLWQSNQHELVRLSSSIYGGLSEQDKLNALQTVLNIEMDYLGCPPVQLMAQDLSADNLDGCFRRKDMLISLDKELLETDAEKALGVLLHEAYHVYQDAVCRSLSEIEIPDRYKKLRMYREAEIWRYEQDHYYGGWDVFDSEQYDLYASQELESSAEVYSKEWTEEYMRFISDVEMSFFIGGFEVWQRAEP